MDKVSICIDCGREVDYLEVFPGPRCEKCHDPIGEAKFRAMTDADLARMWGGE